ncbi:MFS transporter [Paeniglutamicibacter psychrophenolicus]|uniref:MFS family permease n=1 Tax=Paeniglutamicibacter psychrophenolicus TaxID=257454 RepID=A0ABS4W9S9_9MICC|nr:MFS transporter [Paeniglutamicibacter psychrophenolicus]MBP2372888.1 MFS family permease [Paeniglutamicibacter psychrophenolicus]
MSAHKQATRQRTTTALVQVLGLAVWFSATAVGPSLQREWALEDASLVWITTSVQLGFVVGAVGSAFLNLADRFPAQYVLATSAACASACTLAFAIAANSLGPAILFRFLTGLFLAGIYPVGMKLIASWSLPAGRGKAFGILIGALTIGSTVPHLIGGIGILPWRQVMGVAAGLALLAATISALFLRVGPYVQREKPKVDPRHVLALFRQQRPRLANVGYFGHMWELYALWAWLPIFILNSRQSREPGEVLGVGIVVFATMGVGGVIGSMLGGWAADKWGRPQSAAVALAISGSCCLASPIMFRAPDPLLFTFLLLWGASVIADSGVFSTSLSESVDRRLIGTALTTQTAVGFLITVGSIQLVPLFAGIVGWQYAFVVLLPGPVLGVLTMHTLATLKKNNERHSNDYDRALTPVRRQNRPVVSHRF